MKTRKEKKREIQNKETDFLSFECWAEKYSASIDIEINETGANKELDFDEEQEYQNKYNEYVEKK